RDARAAAEGMEMAVGVGARVCGRTGCWPAPMFTAPRLVWLARQHPEWLEGAVALTVGDWVAYRLCGEAATDFSHAGETMLLDVARREWMTDFLAELGLPASLLLPLRPAGTLLGRLTPSAAADLGLAPGIPVAVGGADTQCALLALGAVGPGDVGIVAGTTGPVQGVADRPILDPEGRLWTRPHLMADRWVVESNAGPLGDALDWLAELLFPGSRRPTARLIGEAAQARPGAGGVLSTFGGQVFNARAMAFPVGSLTLSPFLGGDGPSRRADLCRAVLEGLAFVLRANVEQVAGVAQAVSLRMTGGLTRSPFWAQLAADVLGAPVGVSEVPEGTALGAAICAGVAAGLFADLGEGAARLARIRAVHPNEENARTYEALYAEWKDLRAALADGHDRAAARMLESVAAQAARPVRVDFRPKILVTAQMDEASLAELRRLGEVEYANYRETLRVLTGEDLVEALQGVHVFITEVDIVDLEALRQLPDLRVVVACRGQAVNVDVSACTALGIPVLHAPGRNADAVADLTVAFMLALARKLVPANEFLRQPGGEAGDMARMGQAYGAFLGRELWGKTVGLVGLGAVGREVARRLAPFGVRLLVYDPYVRPEEAARYDVELVSLEELLAESDFVSLHAPVTEETRGLIGREALARMKRGAFLVNTARAALVDEEALAEALRSGHLAGAAVDVFSVEPPAWDHPLLQLPNVIATPHIGGNTEEVAAHQGRIVAEDLRRMLAGERPRHVLNPEVLEGFSWTGPRRGVEGVALEELEGRPGPAVSDLQVAPHPTPGPAGHPLPSPGIRPGEGRGPGESKEQVAMTEHAVRSTEHAIRNTVEELLRRFCEKAVADPALRAFAAKRRVTTHYTMTDLGLEFYIGFRDGEVFAGLGAPPTPAEVRMKAKAEVLDGILTGRISGQRAAMSGQLSFSGDVRTAMGVQRVQGDLIRLYTAAREEVGGVDFSVLAAAPAPAIAPPAAPVPVSVPAGEDPRAEMVRAINELYQLGLITATGGNVSVRLEGREECWITPSQLYKGDLRPELMVRIDLAGNVLEENVPAPSSEWPMHTAIYRARPGVGAVVHAHAPYATILALSGLPFLPITTEAAFLGEVPVVPFIMPGTRELAEAVVKAMGKSPVCLLQNHGVVVAATSLRRACNILEVVERTAQLIWGCYAVGKKPPTLPKDVLRTLREMGEMMA
ncbi:MAG: class II aldolase/adducin family protein, partial [Thermoflexales bacterium]|nr:class II aldolase/adducin family protein [Thermoflexales bacterium]